MIFSIQRRLILWLLVVVLPISAASVITVGLVKSHLTDRVIAGLENDHRLEAARIESALGQYKRYAVSLANNKSIREALSTYFDTSATNPKLATRSDVAALEATAASNVNPYLTLSAAIEEISKTTYNIGSGVAEFQISTFDGLVSAQTDGYSWKPANNKIIEQAINNQEALFGEAFLNPDGDARLGIVVPIFAHELVDYSGFETVQRVSGIMTIEMELGPVVDLVEAHEGMGETSESHIAQPTPEGHAEFITLLRFKRDAAFNVTVPKSKDKPINWSLDSPNTHVVRSPDYRNVDSFLAIGTIADTGWGLVAKIDVAEAFIPLYKVTNLIRNAGIASLLLVIISWFTLIRPIALRLRSNAFAANRLARGNYDQLIGDSSQDEIGTVSNSMDQLATDLKADKLLRETVEKKITYQADHDALTDLFNRKHLQDIAAGLARDNPEMIFSVLFMDLDGFKAINDLHGHHTGDEILIQYAKELKLVLPEGSVASRWGGDEFVVILPATEKEAAEDLARLLSDRFEKPFNTSEGLQLLGCSIGISTSSEDLSLADAVNIADAQMYETKQARKRESDLSVRAAKFVNQSLIKNRIEVWYQPIISASGNDSYEVIGTEALLRIRDESGNYISPTDFIPHIHEHDIAIALDKKVITLAFENLSNWQKNELVSLEFYLSVNLCGATASMDTLPEFIAEKIAEFQIPPNSVVIELSEKTQKIKDDILSGLKEVGLRIAVDDIGLLNSNLERLASAEPDIAKFDEVWLAESCIVSGDAADCNIAQRKKIVLQNMVSICSQLGMDCVIEGIEQDHQLSMTREIGIKQFQGFLFDHALPPEQFTEKLNNSLPSIWSNAATRYKHAS